jgi:hypothetical protein
MKQFIDIQISEMVVEDVIFEVEFEGWTDTSGPGPDESHIDIHKVTLLCGKLNIDVTEVMQCSEDLRNQIEAYLDFTAGY